MGDNGDLFPLDGACYDSRDGDAGQCYLTQLGSKTFETLGDTSGTIYFAVLNEEKIFAMDGTDGHFRPVITIGSIEGAGTPTKITYSAAHHRLYIGYNNGLISYINPVNSETEYALTTIAESVRGLTSVGNHILAQDESGAWATHYIIDSAGNIRDSMDWNYYSRVYDWNESNNRVYFFRDDTSPNDLHYETIDPYTGQIIDDGETPYHGDYAIIPPIVVSYDGANVLLGSGDIYDSEHLTWQGALPGTFTKGIWNDVNELITLQSNNGNTLLARYNARLKVLETRVYGGTTVNILLQPDGYAVIHNDHGSIHVDHYIPNDDTDGDGIPNLDDAFPLDPAASADSDFDGYPDAWNEGKTQEDSTTGLVLDIYPNDSACYFAEHGDGTTCNYESTMPEFIPDSILMDEDGVIYMLSSENNRVYRWSSEYASYLDPLVIGSTSALNASSPDILTYSTAHRRLYFGYDTGAITYIDLDGDHGEQPLVNIAMAVNGLAAVGNHILAQDNSGAWETHYIIDQYGNITDSRDWNDYSRVYAWNEWNNRVYYFKDSTSPNDLMYETIDPNLGIILDDGETPYHGDYSIRPPIIVSNGGDFVLLGSGDIYNADALTIYDTLGEYFTYGVWLDSILVTATSSGGTTTLKLWETGLNATLSDTLETEGSLLGMFRSGEQIILVNKATEKFDFIEMPIGDMDNDGIPEWWENKYGMDFDPAGDNDEDGLSNSLEFENKTHPLVSDTDEDGLTDGDEVLVYHTSPLLPDTDFDGLSDYDEVTATMTDPLNHDTDGDLLDDKRELDNGLDPNDPSDAALDNDGDGYSNYLEILAGSDINNAESVPMLGNWGMVQGNSSHNGFQPAELDVNDFSVRWVKTLDGTVSAVATGAAQVFTTGYQSLISLDSMTGEVMWTVANLDSHSSPPSFANDLVYVHAGAHESTAFQAFDSITGSQVFKGTHSAQWAYYDAPTIYGDKAFINGSYYGGMQAFDALDGDNLWSITTASSSDDWEPAVNATSVFHVYEDRLKAVDPSNGAEQYRIGADIPVQTPVLGTMGNVLLMGDEIISIDTAEQAVAWRYADEEDGYYSKLAAGGRNVYAISGSKLIVLNELNGHLLWSWTAPNTLTQNIIVTLSHVFVASSYATYAVDLQTHGQVWSYPVGGKLALGREGALYIVNGSTVTAITIEGDADNDGMPDWWERFYGLNLEPELDQDSDGLTNLEEYQHSTHPLDQDTDGDSLTDGDEIHIHGTDPKSTDTDKDGLTDADEITLYETDPTNFDSDGDSLDDYLEVVNGLNPNDASDADADPDEDGYINTYEIYAGSDMSDALSIPVVHDWGMLQGNAAHNGYQPIMLDPDDFTLRWTKDLEINLSAAATGANQVFVTGNYSLMALDCLTGESTWEYQGLGDHSVSAPSHANDLVYVHTGGHEATAFWAFDDLTGELAFQGTHDSQWPRYSAPTIWGDKAYMNGSTGSGMQAFNALDGSNLWSVTTFDWQDYIEPAAGENHVWMTYSGNLLGLDPSNGSELFKLDLDLLPQTPVIGNRHNLLMNGRQLVSVDIESASVVWRTEAKSTSYSQAATGNGRVYSIIGNTLYVFNEVNGQLLWTWTASSNLTQNIIITINHAFLASSTMTFAVDLQSHDQAWSYPKGGKLALGRDGALYIVSGTTITAISMEGDSDEDGIPDWWERCYGMDFDAGLDEDGDGLSNLGEYEHGTHPLIQDTDGDTLSDGAEVNTHLTDPKSDDTDMDGLKDNEEVNVHATDPNLTDSDGDGLDDFLEVVNGLNPNDTADASADPDEDGYASDLEIRAGSDPSDPSSFPAITNWGMVQGNPAHNGYQPLSLNPDDFSFRWETDLGVTVSAAATGYRNVYVTGGNSLMALDNQTGELAWSSTDPLGMYTNYVSAPSVANGLVYVHANGTYDEASLWGFDAITGEQSIYVTHDSRTTMFRAPTIWEDRAFMNGGYSTGVTALNALDGTYLWTSTLTSGSNSWEPAANGGYVFAIFGDDLLGLDPETGSEIFRVDVDSGVQTPVIGKRNNVLLSGVRIVNVDLDTQTILWKSDACTSSYSQVVSGNGMIYSTSGNTLFVFDEINGQILWSWTAEESLANNIIATFSHVFVAGGSTTYAVDLVTHSQVWSYPAGGKLALGREGALCIVSGSVVTAITIEGDDDNDGLPDWWERNYGADFDPSSDDDGDTLTNAEEYAFNTNPIVSDTDGDGLTDSEETGVYGTNPTRVDTDGDLLSDSEEVTIHHTDPLLEDSDGDGFNDYEEIYKYETDPNDDQSAPDAITDYVISFEDGELLVGWVQETPGAPWAVDEYEASSGSNSLRSGDINDSQSSSIRLDGMFGTGTLSFDAMVEAESCCDKLKFYMDGILIHTISDGSAWVRFSVDVPSGEHSFKWSYQKDSSVSDGADAAWIDNVAFQQ